MAVTNSIASGVGVTYVIAAANGNGADACGSSPAKVNQPYVNDHENKPAIVVGAVNPADDYRSTVSNAGKCLSLFAPGHEILTAMPDNFLFNGCTSVSTTPGSKTQKCSGTSIAAAHVTGVAARILSRKSPNHPVSPTYPRAVWTAMHKANNIYCSSPPCPPNVGTKDWGGVHEKDSVFAKDSPNEMLHYGSLSDGEDDGDTHITTVNGIHYDFQAAGEFVALRDANGMEIQTRQTSVPSAPWVSVNTAIAARVGQRRVTWQPNISGVPDPSGLQLRVDGVVAPIGESGLDLGDGGRILKSAAAADTLEVDFPDGTALFVASHWWAGQSQWYLDVNVFHTPTTEGIMGAIEQDSWLQQEFAETWGVTDETSLFDYATGLSSKTFAISSFPQDKIPPVNSEVLALAQRVCDSVVDRKIADKNRLADCAFDVAVTRDPIFAKSHRLAQKIQQGATTTNVSANKHLVQMGEEMLFTATVTRHEQGGMIPSGKVLFMLNGKAVGDPVPLDANGQARWKTRHKIVDDYRITARYIPDKESVFLSSSSLDELHTVKQREIPHGDAAPKKHDRK